MSTIFSVYLGPFAEWLLPRAGYKRARERAQAVAARFTSGERACLDFDQTSCFDVVKIGNNRFIRECWTAYFPPESTGSGAPPRPFHWASCPADNVGVFEFS